MSTTQGHHEGLSAAPLPAAESGRRGAAPGYASNHTLPLVVELRRQLTRRRTQFALGFLVLLPFLLAAAFELGSSDNGSGGAPALVDLATTGAANFTLFTIFASTGFLLVVVVALFAGDTVASEASWSSLRYLLAAPVPRSRLLRQKLLVALGLSGFSLLLLPAVSLAVGWVAFGWEPVRSPLGSTLSTSQALLRLAIILGYLALSLLFVAALGFVIGVHTDAPLGAVGGAVLLVIVSNILDAVSALGDLRNVLPTHYQYAWTDALLPVVSWGGMLRGAAYSVGYSAVLLLLAWRKFLTKDIVS